MLLRCVSPVNGQTSGKRNIIMSTTNGLEFNDVTGTSNWIFRTNAGAERARISNTGAITTASFPGSSYNLAAVSAFTNGTISYYSSDRRLKHNIQPIENGLDIVNRLKPSTFNLNVDNYAASGFIAQDVLGLVPGAATVVPNDGMLAFNVNGIVAYVAKAVQELDSRTKELKIENEALKTKVAALEESVTRLTQYGTNHPGTNQ